MRRKQTTQPSERLFADPQRDMFEKSHEEKLREEKNMPVECLGMTFENEDILALSDPPYYTACPVKSGVYFTGAIFAMSLLLYAPCTMLHAPWSMLHVLSAMSYQPSANSSLPYALCAMPYALCALCFLGANSILLFQIFLFIKWFKLK